MRAAYEAIMRVRLNRSRLRAWASANSARPTTASVQADAMASGSGV